MCETCVRKPTQANENPVAESGPVAGRRAGNESIEVFVGLLDANDRAAAHDREHSDRHGMLAVYLGSSLGAGKTSLPKPTSGERFLEVLEYDPLARIR